MSPEQSIEPRMEEVSTLNITEYVVAMIVHPVDVLRLIHHLLQLSSAGLSVHADRNFQLGNQVFEVSHVVGWKDAASSVATDTYYVQHLIFTGLW